MEIDDFDFAKASMTWLSKKTRRISGKHTGVTSKE